MKLRRMFIGALALLSLVVVISSVTPVFAADVKSVAKKAAQKEVTYVASSQSKTYHVSTCPMAKNIKSVNLVKFATKADAEKAGYQACKGCIK